MIQYQEKPEPSADKPETMYSIKQCAKRCGVSKDVVYRWIKSGSFPVHHFPGSGKRPIVRIDRTDLDNWRDRCKRNITDMKKTEKETKDKRVLTLEGRKFFPRKKR